MGLFYKKVAILYPSDPLNVRVVDDQFRAEFEAARDVGLQVHCFDSNAIAASKIFPFLEPDVLIIYRGWMFSEFEYALLEGRFGNRLITSTETYLNAHHLPNWYPHLASLTIPSIITDEEHAPIEFNKFSAGRAFIKDYVKSLKTGKGSIVENVTDVARAIADMKFFRGTIEGGIVLRDVVELEANSEYRFFVVNNKIFSPIQDNVSKTELVQEVVRKMAHKKLHFYSVDIATKADGTNIVIEIGDGQVSDYVGWDVEEFACVLKALESGWEAS